MIHKNKEIESEVKQNNFWDKGKRVNLERILKKILKISSDKRFKPITEIVEKLEKVDSLAVRKIASEMLSNRPTLAALGPISRLETYSSFEKRFV